MWRIVFCFLGFGVRIVRVWRLFFEGVEVCSVKAWRFVLLGCVVLFWLGIIHHRFCFFFSFAIHTRLCSGAGVSSALDSQVPQAPQHFSL